VPASTGVNIGAPALRLAGALRALSPHPVGVYRAPGIRPAGQRTTIAPGGHSYAMLERAPGLYEVFLPSSDHPFRAAERLAAAVEQGRERFSRSLLDLTGYLPDAPEVLAVADAFVSVAASGHTRGRELLRAIEHLPTSRHLGVLLVD
jgi:hypothetical protein